MTASDLISVAVNVTQNGWSMDELGYGFDKSEAVQAMLADVNRQVIESNRLAVEQQLAPNKPSP
jgi:hypothetical protein